MADCVQSGQAALILDGIVQQGSDCLILVATRFKNQSAYRHQVGDVGDRNVLSGLLVMQTGGELQGDIESPSQEGDIRLHGLIVRRRDPANRAR
jgi:hypothetical protein